MVYIYMGIAFITGIGVAWFILRWDRKTSSSLPRPARNDVLDYEQVSAVLNERELKLFDQLKWIAGDDMMVLASVRLLSLVSLPAGLARRDFYENMARTRKVDFVMCDAKRLTPRAAILLGNPTGDLAGEDDVDDVVEDVLNTIGIPIVYLAPRKTYKPAELKQHLRSAIGKSGKARKSEMAMA